MPTLIERLLCGMDARLLGAAGIVAAGAGWFISVPVGFTALLAGLGVAYFYRHSAPVALDPKNKVPLTLIEREDLSHDTRRYRFALPTPQHILGLPCGKHMNFSAKVDGKLVVRAYTPVTSNDEVGYVDFVIKVYGPLPPQFPEGGKMSQYVDQLRIGDTLDVRGPAGHIEYAGAGVLRLSSGGKNPTVREKKVTAIGLLAGGTGITPGLQIIRAIAKNPADNTNVHLIFANKTEEDILLRDELDKYSKDPRFHVWYTLDNAPDGWQFSSGFVTEAMIREHLPSPAADTHVLMCGPPPMLKFACIPNLEKIGFTSDMYDAF
jgi:cytochrome-b5 reductase